MKNSFVLYTDYKKPISLLSVEEKAQLLDAIFEYAEGEEVQLEGAALMAFSFIKAQMDRDSEKYEKTCKARKEAGAKGGAPKGNQNAAKQAKQANGCLNKQNKQNNQKQAKQPDNDNDNDTDNDNENVNDTDNENDIENVAEKKKEKIKKEKYGNNVTLTIDEYQKLITDYGYQDTQEAIQFLDDYIADKGYKSKSNYSAIRRWVIDAVRDRRKKKPPTGSIDDFFRQRIGNE